MGRRSRLAAILTVTGLAAFATVSAWIALPYRSEAALHFPLQRVSQQELSSGIASAYGADLEALATAFRAQSHRSFCGPATLATVLRADGQRAVNEWGLFESFTDGVRTFYRGMTLAEVADLAQANGLDSEIVHGDELSVDTFRERLKENLAQDGDFIIVNYDRRTLDQAGAGHMSAVGSYDPERDAFLVLDQAAYRYPWTWIPTDQLYAAIRTLDGATYRGVLFVRRKHPAP